jgi:hypothetical protein
LCSTVVPVTVDSLCPKTPRRESQEASDPTEAQSTATSLDHGFPSVQWDYEGHSGMQKALARDLPARAEECNSVCILFHSLTHSVTLSLTAKKTRLHRKEAVEGPRPTFWPGPGLTLQGGNGERALSWESRGLGSSLCW